MSLAPETLALSKIPWQLFCTLTFRGSVPRQAKREGLLRGWLLGVAWQARVPFDSLTWMARDETGEKFGRHHFHCLIGGMPSWRVNLDFAYRVKRFWLAGFSDIRVWEDRLGAVFYTGQDGANCYEGKKFVNAGQLILSQSLAEVAGTGEFIRECGWFDRLRDRRERERVEQVENCGRQRVNPDNAGLDQREPKRDRSSTIRTGGGLSRALGHLLAVNASDQGLTYSYHSDVTGYLTTAAAR